jgi:outer membrane lipoprotein carrier protein
MHPARGPVEMIMHLASKALLVLVLLSSVSAAHAGDPLDELVARQKGVKTLRADFSQEKHAMLLEKPIKSDGVFYYKADEGVRWQYSEGLLVIYDGEALYVFDPELGEAEKVDEAGGVIGPLSFDVEFLRKDYEIEAERLDGTIRLNLKPREEAPFRSMEITFPDGSPFPREVVMKEETGEETRIEFENISINEPLPDDLFVFSPPPGVTIKERKMQ